MHLKKKYFFDQTFSAKIVTYLTKFLFLHLLRQRYRDIRSPNSQNLKKNLQFFVPKKNIFPNSHFDKSAQIKVTLCSRVNFVHELRNIFIKLTSPIEVHTFIYEVEP